MNAKCDRCNKVFHEEDLWLILDPSTAFEKVGVKPLGFCPQCHDALCYPTDEDTTPVHLRLTVDVVYEDHGVSVEQLMSILRAVATEAEQMGILTGDSSAEVRRLRYEVAEVDEDAVKLPCIDALDVEVPPLVCHECGHRYYLEANGTSHHGSGPDDIEHEFDENHVPYGY